MKVFGLLPPSDLKTVVLVSKQWRVIGETPTLWSWATVTVKNKEDLQKLSKRRTQKLKKVKVANWFEESQSILIQSTAVRPEELFNALLPITTLTSIDGLERDDSSIDIDDFDGQDLERIRKILQDYPDLSGIDPELFARVLSRLSCLSFEIIHPTPPQYEALLSSIAQKDSHVKKLVYDISIIGPKFSQPALFSAAVSNVEECELCLCVLPTRDIQALLETIAKEQGRLKKLRMFSALFSTIDPALLGAAISKLEAASIHQAKYVEPLLSKDQISAILSKAGDDSSRLKKLEITGMREEQKEELDQDVLRQAGLKIGTVRVENCVSD